jgi:itaconate CoA-transferase
MRSRASWRHCSPEARAGRAPPSTSRCSTRSASGWRPPPTTPNTAHHASIAPYGPFDTGSGGPVYFAIQNAREWARFCADVLQQPGLAADPRFNSNARRVEHRDALHAAIAAVFRSLSRSEILDRLEAAQVASARMNSVAEFVAHPQLTARDRWRNVDSPAGPVAALIPPIDIAGVTPVMGSIPALGEHTAAILGELGYGPDTIDTWRREGAI